MEKANGNIININNLDVYYKKTQVLKNITCHIPENKITVIIGQSGCGKTTFLKTMNRIVEEEDGWFSGDICVSGMSISDIPKEVLRKQVGLVFQTPIMFPFSIKKNMLYPLNYHYKQSESEKLERINKYLRIVGLYDEINGKLNIHATKLSGGQKQRLSIARCLCIEPDILMLDEPCSSLDLGNTLVIEKLLQELKQQFTIVLVTHNLVQAKRVADFVIFMDNGELIEANDKSIFSNPSEQRTRKYIEYMDCC